MVSAKDVRDKIIALLVDGEPTDVLGTSIKKWFEGEPSKNHINGYPYGWVEWIGGAVTPAAVKMQVIDSFYIIVVSRFAASAKAENSILSFYDSINDVLKADRSLDGLVENSYISNREVDKAFTEKDYSIKAMRLTFFTRRREL